MLFDVSFEHVFLVLDRLAFVSSRADVAEVVSARKSRAIGSQSPGSTRLVTPFSLTYPPIRSAVIHLKDAMSPLLVLSEL
jgi:hypothetical protein